MNNPLVGRASESSRRHYKTYRSADLQPGRWAFVKRDAVLSWSTSKPMPEFRDAVEQHALEFIEVSTDEFILERKLSEFWIISHRWFSRSHPDWDENLPQNQSAKLKKLQELLCEHEEIRGIWLDFCCVPQGNNADGSDTYVHNYGMRDEAEQRYFRYTLDNIKLLYLTGTVLIFVDQKYMGRFWTQFEAFLSLHKAGRKGVVPKTDQDVEDNVFICEMGAASASAGSVRNSLIDTWRTKSVHEAVEVLSQPDIEVMNQSDKAVILPRLHDLNKNVIEIFMNDDKRREAAIDEKQRQAEEAARRAEADSLRAQEADHKAALDVLDAKIARAEAAKLEAAREEDYGRAKALKEEAGLFKKSRAEKIASFESHASQRRQADWPANVKLDAEVMLAGLEAKLKGLQERDKLAKSGRPDEWDTALIRSIRDELETTKRERDLAEQTRTQAHREAADREQEIARQAEADEKERCEMVERRHAALEAAAAELERDRSALETQLQAAADSERLTMMQTLQVQMKELSGLSADDYANKKRAEAEERAREEQERAEERAREAQQRALEEGQRAEEVARKLRERDLQIEKAKRWVVLGEVLLRVSLYSAVIGGVCWACGVTQPWPVEGIKDQDEHDFAESVAQVGFVLTVAATSSFFVVVGVFACTSGWQAVIGDDNFLRVHERLDDVSDEDDAWTLTRNIFSGVLVFVGGITWLCGAGKAGRENQMHVWLVGCVMTSLGLAGAPGDGVIWTGLVLLSGEGGKDTRAKRVWQVRFGLYSWMAMLNLSVYTAVSGGAAWYCGVYTPWPVQGISAEKDALFTKSTREAGFIVTVVGLSGILAAVAFVVVYIRLFPDARSMLAEQLGEAFFLPAGAGIVSLYLAGITWACGAGKAGPVNQTHVYLAGCVGFFTGLGFVPFWAIFALIQLCFTGTCWLTTC
mmetsp:Transcript_34929/g.80908  ORF Transcript_34929/g.80908 Transcript_34929/m.80908 type:complete len:927 (-) Transcript_34929:130-2910(-)